MRAKIQVENWLPKHGTGKDVYDRMSTGILHAGASFRVDVNFPPDVEAEIRAAWEDHGGFPVFRMFPISGEHK